jgi:hypothetical protein
VRKAASVLFLVLCVAVSVAGAYNVFSDNAEVKAAAEQVACQGKPCSAQTAQTNKGARPAVMTRLERSPFAQTFTFALPPNGAETTVHCRRSAIFVGAYTCHTG